MLKIKRVYEPATKEDGKRILVDRLWPRGISKEKAKLDLWLKEIAPSTELRKWFNHDPKKWAEFKKRYVAELKKKKDLLNQIPKNATIIYAAKDEKHNEALVLKNFLDTYRSK
jgi:uncharacterized protein YeaO (DUF488 family)